MVFMGAGSQREEGRGRDASFGGFQQQQGAGRRAERALPANAADKPVIALRCVFLLQPHIRFIYPTAPTRPITVNMGMKMPG